MEPQQYRKREKDSVTLFCPVKQDDSTVTPIEILWYKDGRPIDAHTVANIKVRQISFGMKNKLFLAEKFQTLISFLSLN